MTKTALLILVLASVACKNPRAGYARSEGRVGGFDTFQDTVYIEGGLPSWQDDIVALVDDGQATHTDALILKELQEINAKNESILELIKELTGPAALTAVLGYGAWRAKKKA